MIKSNVHVAKKLIAMAKKLVASDAGYKLYLQKGGSNGTKYSVTYEMTGLDVKKCGILDNLCYALKSAEKDIVDKAGDVAKILGENGYSVKTPSWGSSSVFADNGITIEYGFCEIDGDVPEVLVKDAAERCGLAFNVINW